MLETFLQRKILSVSANATDVYIQVTSVDHRTICLFSVGNKGGNSARGVDGSDNYTLYFHTKSAVHFPFLTDNQCLFDLTNIMCLFQLTNSKSLLNLGSRRLSLDNNLASGGNASVSGPLV